MGSPQSYWDKSARELGLVDTDGKGIGLRDGSVLTTAQREGREVRNGEEGYDPAAAENRGNDDNGYGPYNHHAPHHHPVNMSPQNMSPQNMSPGQQHHMMSEHGHHAESYATDHAIVTTPREETIASHETDTAGNNNEGQPPSEADASILLMLKNPDAASPKSENDNEGMTMMMSEVQDFNEETSQTHMAQV